MKRPFGAYRGEDPFVFVCYAHEDSDVVFEELVWLKAQGLNIWYDEGISPGEEWPEEVATAIEAAESFLLFVSPNSVESRYCRDEVNYALRESKRLVAVHLSPTNLGKGLNLSIGTSQAILKFDYAEATDYRRRLLESISQADGQAQYLTARKHDRPKLQMFVIAAIALLSLVSLYVWQQQRPEEVVIPSNPKMETSIAVLPFVDMSAEGNMEYMGDGLAEELINGFAQIPGLRVIARTSSFFFKGQNVNAQTIGQKLGVETILEGSIRKAEDRVRITVQLIDVENGFHLWSNKYDRTMNDIFLVQEEVANKVVGALRPQLNPDDYSNLMDVGTRVVSAYNAFLLGRHERSRLTLDGVNTALIQFKLAIERDPDFLRAYLALIDAYDYKGAKYGNRTEMMMLATSILDEAKKRDPDRIKMNWFWLEQFFNNGHDISQDFDKAEKLYSAMILDRSHPANGGYAIQGFFQYGLLLAKSGFYQAGVDYMQPLELIEPMEPVIKFRLAEFLAALGQYDNAIAKFDEAISLNPYYMEARLDKFLIYGKLGRLEEARGIRAELASVLDRDMVALADAYLLFWHGNIEQAISDIDRLTESPSVPTSYKGMSYLMMKRFDRGIDLLEQASDQADGIVGEMILIRTRLLNDETWNHVKELPRFIALMERYGYNEKWPSELAVRANLLSHITRVTVSNSVLASRGVY